MNALGYAEHREPFNDQNLPASNIEKAYHISAPSVSTQAANQRAHEFDYTFVLSVFKRGFRKVGNLLDNTDLVADTVLEQLLDPQNRLSSTEIKDIQPSGYVVRELSDSNDNIAVIEFSLNARVIICFGA